MADEKHEYCKIFLRVGEAGAVVDLLTASLDAQADRRRFSLPSMEVEVLANPDKGMTEDFIGWPILGVVSRISTAAQDAGIAAVAACDYEDELPWQGRADTA
ncbi:hypothetical protein AB0N89_16855 [Amycolatopsis sp. NPDC089917]|uniref:hypothetical protein n=1 Tax=Amycolatopsis sp. NPDC089917 TaxID=3155187 RepID=UPI0034408AD5